jgi:murein DD-endopeptidase MepM/ murein hydrolase activator NlpD
MIEPMAGVTVEPASGVEYRPPVDAAVIEGFHAPASPYAAGNRGLEYATSAGLPVRAAAAGTVVFAGRVPAGWAVTVQHADGVRTALTGLGSLVVRRGQQVALGEVVGTTRGDRLFLSARIGEAYIDPALLFGADGGFVHLVPDRPR